MKHKSKKDRKAIRNRGEDRNPEDRVKKRQKYQEQKQWTEYLKDYHEILPGLWVGCQDFVHYPEWDEIVDCRHLQPDHEGYVDTEQLDILADEIFVARRPNKRVYVHCYAGMERSPLVVAWYMQKYVGHTLNSAYKHIQEKHPQTQNRECWIRRD